MSEKLITLARRFVADEITAEKFVDTYIRDWKEERDSAVLLEDPPNISRALSSIFCLADLHCDDGDREPYELGSEQLKDAIRKELRSQNT